LSACQKLRVPSKENGGVETKMKNCRVGALEDAKTQGIPQTSDQETYRLTDPENPS